jgi:predicted permease
MHTLHPLLAAFVPIWALTAVGYLVGRTGLLGEQAEAVLGRFVFHVAMPAALFMMISRTPLDSFANPSMAAFAAGTAAASLLGATAARWWFGRDPADRTIAGMASGYVNSANLGIPVALQVLGDASFIAPVLVFQVLVVTPVVLTLLDARTRSGGDGAEERAGRVSRLLMMPLRNPIVLAAALGALASATGWHLPPTLGHSCEVLGGAGVPTALVTLGMSLHGRRTAEGPARRTEVGLTVVTKTLIQPLTALAVGSLLLHLPPHQLLAVVVCSALPTAQNVFTYAREYGLNTALARDSVMYSTLVSMGTLSAAGWLLGRG